MTAVSFPMTVPVWRRAPSAAALCVPTPPVDWSRQIEPLALGLADLPAGWDGDDAPAPTEGTIRIALDELRRFTPAGVPMPQVHPTVGGGVQFEWHCRGWSVEVEVTPSGQTIAWGENQIGDQGWDGTLPEVREDLITTLKHLAA